jgi:hypothetical protein
VHDKHFELHQLSMQENLQFSNPYWDDCQKHPAHAELILTLPVKQVSNFALSIPWKKLKAALAHSSLSIGKWPVLSPPPRALIAA